MFNGSFVALVTPMDEQGRLDSGAIRKLISFHLETGTDGLVIGGTTGESASLTTDEFSEMLSLIVRLVDSAIPVLAGTGSANTQKSIKMTKLAASLGADAALVVTPYYNRPMQSGLLAHFTAIADTATIPLILYNVPARTGVDMQADTTSKLAQHEMIHGIKEALPDMGRIARLVELCPQDFSVMSGDDPSCREAIQAGAQGVVSVAANVEPSRMHRLCEAALSGDHVESAAIDTELRELFRLLAIESNPIPVKWAASERGLIKSGIRLPLLPLEDRHRDAVRACLQLLQE